MSDLISKQAVREALLKKGQSSKRYKLGETWELNWFEIEDALSSIPIMETEPVKHAHWVEKQDMNGDTYYHCTNCKEDFVLVEGTPKDNLYCYCPNCGYKMDGGADE